MRSGVCLTGVDRNGAVVACFEPTADMAEVIIDFSTATSVEERTAILKKTGLKGKEVYDLKGQVVVNGSNLMDKGQLKKGIYIIDGKKVTIK
jgi:enhancing lycopene biosynthesis protein 2